MKIFCVVIITVLIANITGVTSPPERLPEFAPLTHPCLRPVSSQERRILPLPRDPDFILQTVDLEACGIVIGFPGEEMTDTGRFIAAVVFMEKLLKGNNIPLGYQPVFDVSEDTPDGGVLLANVRDLRHLFFETEAGVFMLESICPQEKERAIWRRRLDMLAGFLETHPASRTVENNMLEIVEALEIRKTLNTLGSLFNDAGYLSLLTNRRLNLRKKYGITDEGVIVLSKEVRRICNDLSSNFLSYTGYPDHGLAEAVLGRAFLDSGIRVAYSRDPKLYPRDRNSFLPGRKTVIMPIYDDESFRAAHITAGGNAVDGYGNTGLPFIIFSDTVPRDEVDRLLRHPECGGLEAIRLPSGFTRARANGRDILIESQHIDTVVGFVPSPATKDGRSKLLMDPTYFNSVKSGALTAFLKRHGFSSEDGTLVMVDESETHLMPCNLDFLPGGRLVINRAPKTIGRLRLKEDAVIQPSKPIEHTAFFGAGIRCIFGYNIPGLYQDQSLFAEEMVENVSHRIPVVINQILKVAGVNMPPDKILAALRSATKTAQRPNRSSLESV